MRHAPGRLAAAGWPQVPGTLPGEGKQQAAGERPGVPRPQPQSARAGAGWPQVPGWLQRAAGWSWRLLIVGVVIYLTLRMASALRLVVLPCVAALLLTALLQPLAQRLRRLGLPALAATWCALLAAVAVLAGAGTLAVTQTSADYPTLVTDVGRTAHDVEQWLAGPPFQVRQADLAQLSDRVLMFLKQHQSAVAGTVLSGGKLFVESLAGLVLMIFVTFFLLKDGERIWAWLTSFLGPEGRRRFEGAGAAAWQALTYYVRGTIAVAAIHAVVIGLALWVLGVPLLIPLIIVVFIAAFVPILGFLVAGALAIAVTAATRGWLAAVVLVAIFILENQAEGHLLQPLVVGRMIRLHPLAIILVLAIGGVVAGIPGAIVAVPTMAALTRAARTCGGSARDPRRVVMSRGQCPGGSRVTSVTTVEPPASATADAVPVLIKRLDENVPLPARAHPGDAGADLVAAADVTLAPGERAVVPTGIAIALPDGYAAFVHPRSGLAARHGVTIVNAPGTVDAGYRGEIRVTLLNTDPAEPVRFTRGDRIAQLVIQRVACPVFYEVESLPGSARGDGGFGSTGGHEAGAAGQRPARG